VLLKKLVYYDADRDGKPIQFTTTESIFGAITDAAAGFSKYKNSESFVERTARVSIPPFSPLLSMPSLESSSSTY
jgi:hypothetical protein